MPAPAISVDEVLEARERGEDLVLIDCRSGAEFETAHIPGSFNVPLEALDELAGDLAGLDLEIVSVCQSGARAEQALGKLAAAGAPSVRVLSGGVSSWDAAGAPLERGTPRWAMDRQVRGAAGGLSLLGLLLGVRFPKARLLSWAIAAGLTYSALSNSCYMAQALSKLPYNRTDVDPDAEVRRISHERGVPLAATA